MSDRPPAPEELERFLAHLHAHGVRFHVDAALRQDPDQSERPHALQPDEAEFVVPGLPPMHEQRRGRVGSDHATWSVAVDMATRGLVAPGSTFWDIGTGSGLLALTASALGAAQVVATEICADVLASARENLVGASADVRFSVGSLLEAVPPNAPPPHLISANLPHKPEQGESVLPLAEAGGLEGDALLGPFFEQAAARLPAGAAIVFFQHSLPHPRNLAQLSEHFDLRLLSWKRRFLGTGEYGSLQDWFVERSRDGTSYVADADGGRFLIACVWLASRR